MTSIKNSPDLWKDKLPVPQKDGHKYNRGHALIYGAPQLTGATRLAASACARIGAGLTTVLADPAVADVYRVSLPAHIMVRDALDWMDDRITARLYGPGGVPCGVDYSSDLPTILDADALANIPTPLIGNYILTPHDGEFAKTFPDFQGLREERSSEAAKRTGAVIVSKGAQTIIADAQGRVVTNDHASSYLASAGTGDVLAGMITGLCAAGMAPFDAACAAVWVHGEAGIRIGAGLVASDIPEIIPEILHDFA